MDDLPAPRPGWYATADGSARWWDGEGWGDGPPQVGPPQVGPPQVGPPQVGPPQVGPRDVLPATSRPLPPPPPGYGPPAYGPPAYGPPAYGPYGSYGQPYDPAAGRRSSSTIAAIGAHMGWLACSVIVPLVIFLAIDRRDRFTRHHAREALNFQLTVLLVSGLGYAAFMVLFFGTFSSLEPSGSTAADDGADGGASAGLFCGFIAIWGVLMCVQLGVLVMSILASVRAYQGVWWRYPVSIRFVPDRDGGPPPT